MDTLAVVVVVAIIVSYLLVTLVLKQASTSIKVMTFFGLFFLTFFIGNLATNPAARIAMGVTGFGTLDDCVKKFAIPAGYADATRYGYGYCRQVTGDVKASEEQFALASCVLPMLPKITNRTGLQLAHQQCRNPRR